jgi:DisA bacterial checkpoint controller nucleotide-binding
MPRGHAYPPDLARYVEALWPASAGPLRLSSKLLDEALSAAFQASLATEEARAVRFRLLLMPLSDLPESGAPNRGVLRLKFDHTRPLHEDELRRLAPAAAFETALIGAHAEDDRLRIWGVAHSGPAWLAPTWGGRSLVPNWTHDPIVHVTGPGKIAVRSAGKLVAAIERGLLVDAAIDVFDSEWLPQLFVLERQAIVVEHDALQVQSAVPTSVEHSLVGRVNQQMLRRAIQLIRGARHGGMLLMADSSDASLLSPQRLRLKYRITQDEPSHRYRQILLALLGTVADGTTNPSVGWSDFESNQNPRLEKLEQAVFELSRAIANLTAIDGAVVLDKQFGLLGFGAEVSAELPAPAVVLRALDTEGRNRIPDDIENVGTRHRAAYRFVNDHPSGLAIVVSQDGGVTFVANRGGEVVFWEQSVSP